MKNTFFPLLFLMFGFVAGAQTDPYLITIELRDGADSIVCRIQPRPNANGMMTSPWAVGDLITWIFPDGQMMQREIAIVADTISNFKLSWFPAYHQPVALDSIKAYVARKGGTGHPTLVMPSTNSATQFQPVNTQPRPINFPAGRTWKANYTWEFSPGKENFLVISYKHSGECIDLDGQFKVELPTEISIIESIVFNSEQISVDTNGNKLFMVSATSRPRNIFLKLKMKDTVTLGRQFEIKIYPTICNGEDADTRDISLLCVAKGEPHDPNYKIVDVQKIPVHNPDSTKLTYTIQFHNDGEAPVKKVRIIDTLPPELDPKTFKLLSTPLMNGLRLDSVIYSPSNPAIIELTFVAPGSSPGLPGLNQANHPAFAETIYRFSFEVKTRPNVQTPINNDATVIFYSNDGFALPEVITGIAQVKIGDSPKIEPSGGNGPDWPTWLLSGFVAFILFIGLYLFRRHTTKKP